ncbi:hypothetical protein Scep_020326 [Stephania cephalantha]|uniref:Origin recognition complex subunit 2 n=1 Tax=Stephania cephalantha TaxID=152367 RepID=A0AAP0NMC0_9MAGN
MDVNDVEEDEFGFSRNYFLGKELRGSTGKKSARKLSDIDLVDEQELREAASRIKIKHEKDIGLLVDSYKSLYSKWAFELRCGFGLLMYGFGSKRSLLEDFASSALTDSGVVVMNGYLQSVNIKQVAIALAELLWDQMKAKRKTSIGGLQKTQQPFSSQSMEDLTAFLDGSQTKDCDCFVCVVVHNIDGPGIRELESQQYLSRLASCSHVRMIASIDNVNAPLLWDKKMVHTQFNWCWYHVPTFMPYKVEGMFFPLILASSGSSQNAKTAVIVLQSLTPNAQSVFKVLAEYQPSDPEFPFDRGMFVFDNYSICSSYFHVWVRVSLLSCLTSNKTRLLVNTYGLSDYQETGDIELNSVKVTKLDSEIM